MAGRMGDEDVPRRPSRGDGVYRRRYRLTASCEETVRRVDAELEDDFHHFAVSVVHDGASVDVVGEAIRTPWTTCPGALDALRGLVGHPLVAELDGLARVVDPTTQCTHLYDLACLAITHAATGRSQSIHDVAVDEPRAGTRRAAHVRDSVAVLVWEVDELTVRSEGPFRDVRVLGEPFRRALAGVDPETRLAAGLLRKGLLASYSRLYDMDLVRRPVAFGEGIRASCHTFRPGVVEHTHRNVGATSDFTDAPDALLDDGRVRTTRVRA